MDPVAIPHQGLVWVTIDLIEWMDLGSLFGGPCSNPTPRFGLGHNRSNRIDGPRKSIRWTLYFGATAIIKKKYFLYTAEEGENNNLNRNQTLTFFRGGR